MAQTTNLQELANALPVEERRRLYERIRQSLSLHDQSRQRIFHAELPRSRREEIMRREKQALRLWDRFVFWLMRLFSVKTDDEVFLRFRLNRLRETIRSAGAGLVDFESRVILPEFPRRVYLLYRLVYPVSPMFRQLWYDEHTLEQVVSFLLEKRVPGAKTELNEFMPTSEMQDLYMETENKQSIRKEISARLDHYLNGVQADLFYQLEEGILPLYYLKDICLFPYNEFFKKFGVDIGYDMPANAPEFKSVRAMDIEPYLEQLYFALYNARRLPVSLEVHSELLSFYLQHTQNVQQDDSAGARVALSEWGGIAPATKYESERTAYLRTAIRKLREEAERVHDGLALAEIIKYLHEDPYYRFVVYMPKLNLREFYASALSISLLGQLEMRIEDIRMGVTGRMITAIFAAEPPELDNYRGSNFSWTRQLGVSTPRYVKSLNILYNYIQIRYLGELHEFVHGLRLLIPNRYRDVQSTMLFHATGLEDLGDKIQAYDETFGKESDEGKTIDHMRLFMEKDTLLQRSFRTLMAKKDHEARMLLDKGIEHIRGLHRAFSDLLRSGEFSAGGQFTQPEETNAIQLETESAMSRHVDMLSLFEKLLDNLIAMEEGY